jgi:thymidylate kinase
MKNKKISQTKATKFQPITGKSVIKIVFAGPPSSGKTTILSDLKNMISEDGLNDIYFLNESATEVIKNFPDLKKEDELLFQELIYFLQVQKERIIEDNKTHGVIITDRGTADSYIYLSESQVDMWKNDDKTPPLESLSDLLQNYDAVIYFEPYLFEKETIANGTVRLENNEDEIEELKNKSKTIWAQHDKFITVKPTKTVEEKIFIVADILNEILGGDIFIKR